MGIVLNNERLRRLLASNWVQTICQLFLGGIFLYAGLGKIVFHLNFIKNVRNYRLLPEVLVEVFSYVLPWLEVIFGILLILGIFKRISAVVISTLLLVFIGAILIDLLRGIDVSCGCFFQTSVQKTSSSTSMIFTVFRDILFLVPGVLIILFQGKRQRQI